MKNSSDDTPAAGLDSADSDLIRAYRRYFMIFLPELMNRLLIEDLHSLNCRFAYRIAGADEPPWTLTVESGRLVDLQQGAADAECCFICTAPVLIDIITAAVAPQEAFFAMDVEIEGDLELGMRLSSVLAPFFRRYPFRA